MIMAWRAVSMLLEYGFFSIDGAELFIHEAAYC
jgi:hypothetical protein